MLPSPAAISVALTVSMPLLASGAPRPASPSSLDFSLLVIPPRSLCGGLLGCLGVVMASVGDVGESSHDHDRDDHGATEEGNVRMTVHERHAQESADPIGSTQTLGMMRLKGDVAICWALALPVWITRIFASPVWSLWRPSTR